MNIIEFSATNVLRLRDVGIKPNGDVQIIGGDNANGKSSVLNAIWLALGGKDASKNFSKIVHNGQDKAQVRLDLGDLVVTRTWDAQGKTRLQVSDAEGHPLRSPQTRLDALVGRLAYDPLAFMRKSPREQRSEFLEAVGVDLSSLDEARKEIYDERTEVTRAIKAVGTPQIDPDLPEKETSLSDLLAQIQECEESNRQYEQLVQSRDAHKAYILQAQEQIKQLQESLEASQRAVQQAEEQLSLRQPVDTSELRTRLSTAEEQNAFIAQNSLERAKQEKISSLQSQHDDLTKQLEEIDQAKLECLRDSANLVPELTVEEDSLYYNGSPLSQASSAEQLKVSAAIGAAADPEIRVMLIRDASLLDRKSLQYMYELAEDLDFQIWLERVGDADADAVIIEDGYVSENNS